MTKGGVDQYKPEYCEALKVHMRAGRSFATFVAVVEVSRKTLYKWAEKYPEFGEAKEIAFALALKHFEDRLIVKGSGQKVKGVDPKSIDLGAIIFPLKTRFHEVYGERLKTENTNTSTGEVTVNFVKSKEKEKK